MAEWFEGRGGRGCVFMAVRTVKRECLAYVNMRCHTYPEKQSALSHCLCITGAESSEDMP